MENSLTHRSPKMKFPSQILNKLEDYFDSFQVKKTRFLEIFKVVFWYGLGIVLTVKI